MMIIRKKKSKPSLFDRQIYARNTKPDAWHRSQKHLAWIRTLPCACGCGAVEGIQAAHIRIGADGAMGRKPADFFTVPLTAYCHRVQHSMGEPAFWASHGQPFPAQYAAEAFGQYSPCHDTRNAARKWLFRK